ncbi:MAG: cobalt-precorrin-6A reductase [Pseudomonadota bacterium]
MILLLAGTSEGREMAEGLEAKVVPFIASLAGATRAPGVQGEMWRTGGFGGAAGFEDFLEANQISAVLDLTHPFADRITQRSAKICAERGVPFAQVLRAPWKPGPGDLWHQVNSETECVDLIAAQEVVFLATGRQTLDRFQGLKCRAVYCRQIDPPTGPFPFERGQFVIGRPPFSEAEEIALFKELEVDWLVVKNAGGDASRSKLDAARKLGIRVAMINRPPEGSHKILSTVEAAETWLDEVTG